MSTPNLPYGTAATGSTATDWANAILSALGAPATSANVNSLKGWFGLEGGGGQNNPLNTTLHTSGSIGSINAAGVQSYGTPAAGAAATAATLSSGLYPAIADALKSGKGLAGSTSSQIASELSTWSGGGYSAIGGPGAAASSPSSPSSPSSAAAASGPTAADSAFLTAFTQANTTGFNLNPITDITNAWNAIAGVFTGTVGVSEALSGLLQAIVEIGPKLDEIFHALLWFLYPSHWVRIFLVLFGLVLLIPGFYGLMHTGTGDMYLAMGILLTTMAGILLFLGFHNVPEDVQNVAEFVGWLSEGIKTGALPAGAGQPPPSGFGALVDTNINPAQQQFT